MLHWDVQAFDGCMQGGLRALGRTTRGCGQESWRRLLSRTAPTTSRSWQSSEKKVWIDQDTIEKN
eukprot:4027211-Pyramimonas_sp.AAC.1